MARISAGLDFGQAVVQPARTQPVDVSPGVAAVANSLERVGAEQQADGQQLQRQQDAEARQAAREAQLAREHADRGAAIAKGAAMRDTVADELDRIGQEVQDGRLPKTEAAKAWQDRTAKILADNIEGVPETHRAAVQADMQALTGRLTSKVGDIVRKRDQGDTLAAITQVQEYTQRLAVTEPDKARQLWLDTVEQLGPFAGLQPDQIAKSKQGWIEGTAYTRAFTAVNAAKTDNKALAAVELGINKNADLDPQRKATLLAQVDGYRASNEARALRQAQHAEIVAQRVERQSTEAYNILSGWALQGKQADPAAAAGLISRLTPTAATAYRAMAAEIPARTAVAMQPLDVQAQQLDTLKARAVTGTSVDLEREIKRREEVLTQARKDYADDPLRAANERGVITSPLKPLNMTSLETIIPSLVERVQQSRETSIVTKKPESPFFREEASKLGDILNALPVKQRSEWIARASAVMPADQAQALAQQIDKTDKGLALELAAGMSRTTEARFVAQIIGNGRQKLADLKVEPGGKGDQARQRMRAEILEYIGDGLTGKTRENVVEAALLIHYGSDSTSGTIEADRAVRLAMGGEFVKHNGGNLPVPMGLGLDGLRDKLRAMPFAAVNAQAPDGFVYSTDGRPRGVPEFLATLPEQSLMPAGQLGTYYVRSGSGVAMNSQGKKIVIRVQ
jgi:hypothetical protein